MGKKTMGHLGGYQISKTVFKNLKEVFKQFHSSEFKSAHHQQKSDQVNRCLLTLLQTHPSPAFLLSAVIDFINRILQEEILENYSLQNFELWLNQFSSLTMEENFRIRGRIMGKYVPREEYQILFPVGMGKVHSGSHYVTAHGSPDLDTTIASFWGWVDAFACRVSEGLHLWNVPTGSTTSPVEIDFLFHELFGKNLFQNVAKNRSALALSSFELMNQKGVSKKLPHETTLVIDQERIQHTVIVVDEAGHYLGDWRSFDVEGVRQVIMSLNLCLSWMERRLHVHLISLFAKEKLTQEDVKKVNQIIFETRIQESAPAKDFTQKQKKQVDDYLRKVLKVEKGLESTFEAFAESMQKLSLFDFKEFLALLKALPKSHLFDRSGNLQEMRSQIFHYLEKIIQGLDKAIQSVHAYVERLDVALSIKREVFGYFPQVLNYRSDIEEIRSKMGFYPSLTVTYTDEEGWMIPLGVVHATDIHKPILGTVTLRDFCNREETKIPSYFEIISVIDHHKSTFTTSLPAVIHISDGQSSNAIVARLAFAINDAYSTGGMTLDEIDLQIQTVCKDLFSLSAKRVLQRLLQKKGIAENRASGFFISPEREYIEYLHFLYGILDDTDLLTKVSYHDVECVASLLNRLKSLSLKQEVEVVVFDDLPRDQNFVQAAANRLLQHQELYSLYKKIYRAKEEAIEKNIELCAKGAASGIFSDTKEQNGCARVGQTKIFANNYPTFHQHLSLLRKYWLEIAQRVYLEKLEYDLHLQMISTIAGAEDLFAGNVTSYTHQDELWIWIPSTEGAIAHLKSFLNALASSPSMIEKVTEVEFLGENAKELEEIFIESFLPIPRIISKKPSLPIAVLRYKAGSINSRKAMISPYLPKLVS